MLVVVAVELLGRFTEHPLFLVGAVEVCGEWVSQALTEQLVVVIHIQWGEQTPQSLVLGLETPLVRHIPRS